MCQQGQWQDMLQVSVHPQRRATISPKKASPHDPRLRNVAIALAPNACMYDSENRCRAYKRKDSAKDDASFSITNTNLAEFARLLSLDPAGVQGRPNFRRF